MGLGSRECETWADVSDSELPFNVGLLCELNVLVVFAYVCLATRILENTLHTFCPMIEIVPPGASLESKFSLGGRSAHLKMHALLDSLPVVS